jgi:hypothetical protein
VVDTKTPSIKDQSETKPLPDKISDFFVELRRKVETDDIKSIEGWKDKMRIARNMRQGIKRTTDFPYPGAPDIPLPETDKIIRKHKPRFVMSILSGKRLMSIRPLEGVQVVDENMKEMAKRANMAMNWLFKKPSMDWIRKLTLNADRFLEKGHCIFKIIERYNSRMVNKVVDLDEFLQEELDAFKSLTALQKKEFLSNRYGLDPDNEMDKKTLTRILSEFNSGKRVIKFSTEEVQSLPDVLTPMPEKVYVPKGTTNINKASRITNEFFLSEHELMQLAQNNILIKERVLNAIKNKDRSIKKGDDDFNEQQKDRLEGIDDNSTGAETYRIHETIVYRQSADDKPFEKWVFVSFADVSAPKEAIIQWMPYPYEYDGWNYVKHDNEVVDDRYRASRGVPEQIRAIQEFMERAVNSMLTRDEINNAPMFTVRNNANLISDTVRFIPGQRINVNDHDDIKQLSQTSNVDVSSERIAQMLKAYAEEYVGIPDQMFRNATNSGGGKTLGEIQLGTTEAQFAVQLDILNWTETVKEVYTKVFLTFKERLVHPLVINGTIITREDFQFEPDITVIGSLEMADKGLQLQRSQLRLERARTALQDGVATREDLFRAYEDYLEKDGVKEPNDFITDPNEILQQQITQLENQVIQLQSILKDTQSEIAQADNTLRQIETQIIRKSGPSKPGGNGGVNRPQQGNAANSGAAPRNI